MTAKEKAAEEERLRKEEEERKRKEEEARLKAEEEERKRKEEEEKKAKEKKGGAKGKGKAAGKGEEEAEEPVEETEEQKLEREKGEVNHAIEEVRAQIKAFEEKVRLCQAETTKKALEAEAEKVVELCERTGERKHMKQQLDQNATELLRERKAYVLCQIKQVKRDDANEEEVVENIVIDGACIRTPEEDAKWAEEQAELEAQAAKGGKKAPAGKKK